MNTTAQKNASAVVEDCLSTSTAVTEVIDRIPRADMQSQLEQSLPAQSGAPHPRRGRMTVVTWIGIFPLVYVYERVLSWIMPPDTPILLRIAAITALVVPTMSYLVSPQLIRLFKTWLYPRPS
jgi:antibiotic biosynthesis monooxygenase (ABM) superfamily enzyme